MSAWPFFVGHTEGQVWNRAWLKWTVGGSPEDSFLPPCFMLNGRLGFLAELGKDLFEIWDWRSYWDGFRG